MGMNKYQYALSIYEANADWIRENEPNWRFIINTYNNNVVKLKKLDKNYYSYVENEQIIYKAFRKRSKVWTIED